VTPGGGRRLRYELAGPAGGAAVVLMHGMPGSRIGPLPRPSVLHRVGVRLISYDRPGYGGSDRAPGRTVADCAADVAAIADDLGLSTFAVVGRSAGGPHALACAALLPDRVTRVAVLVSPAPTEAGDIDWYDGMNEANTREFGNAVTDQDKLVESLRLQADRIRRDPRSKLTDLRRDGAGPDRFVLDDPAIQEQLLDSYAEAVRHGAGGWIDDALALRRYWGFRVQDVGRPVRLWHGAEDRFVPAEHAHWLRRNLPDAHLEVQADTAHFGAMEILPGMLAWLGRRESSERVRVEHPGQVSPVPHGVHDRMPGTESRDQPAQCGPHAVR
jgi:pimeloyl-ACP methyl ester carboxylesterase